MFVACVLYFPQAFLPSEVLLVIFVCSIIVAENKVATHFDFKNNSGISCYSSSFASYIQVISNLFQVRFPSFTTTWRTEASQNGRHRPFACVVTWPPGISLWEMATSLLIFLWCNLLQIPPEIRLKSGYNNGHCRIF